MGLRADVANGVHQVQCRGDVVRLHENRVVDVDHGIGRGRTLTQMHHSLRLELVEDLLHVCVFAQMPRPEAQFLAETSLETNKSLLDVRNGHRTPRTHLLNPLSSAKIVHTSHLVAARSEILRQWPAQITVNSRNEYSHSSAFRS